MFRLFLVYSWFFSASAVLFFLFILRPFDLRNALLWCRVVPPLARWILNVEYEVRNHERMKLYHPCIFIANHQHTLDLLIFAETLVAPTTALGKKELKYIPFYGWLFWLSGQILIDRSNREKAIKSVDIAADFLKEKNASIWVFPEGTRSQGKGLGLFKKGAFYLAVKSQRPIVPLVTNTVHTTLNFNKWRPGKVVIEVLEPISSVGYTETELPQLMELSRNKMLEHIALLDQELLNTNPSTR